MAGHSKWANIKHKKERQDAKRGKIFTKIIKEITIASKLGGIDINHNPRLRLAIDKALSVNMPKDNIKRAMDRGNSKLIGVNYIELRYEGYAIAGSAIIVDCLTENKIRTIADVRHVFSKHGGNLGTDGCVSYQFKHQGYLLFSPTYDEEKLTNLALNLNVEDVIVHDDGFFEIITNPNEFTSIKKGFEEAGFIAEDGEITMKSCNEVQLFGDDAVKMQKLIDALEELDDVQNVYISAILNI